MKKSYICLFSSILALLILIALIFYLNLNNSEKECKSDSDCVMAKITCCPCQSGGQQACVSKENASHIQESLANTCQNLTICPQFYNCNINSCLCKEGRCQS
jgi:hypothetical protein